MANDGREIGRSYFGLQGKITLAVALVCAALAAVTTTVGVLVVRQQQALEIKTDLTRRLAILKHLSGGAAAVWAIKDGQLTANGVVMNGKTDVVDAVNVMAGGVATIFQGDQRVATNVKRPDGTRGVGTNLAPGSAYDAVIGRGQTYQGVNDILGRAHHTIYEPIKDAAGQRVGSLFGGAPTADSDAIVETLMRDMILAGVGVTALATLLLYLLTRREINPILRLTPVMERLGRDEAPGEIPGVARRDEVGAMARAAKDLVDNLGRMRALDAERVAELQKASAERREARVAMADGFDAAVGRVVAGVASSADTLRVTAREMESGLAGALSEMSEASRASALASTSVQSVAASSEQLSHSIREIAEQVAKSAGLASDAQREAERTDAQVEALARAAEKIGSVVQLINEIASQTNLLALNATIEAARAGDAGKGFAVVANEVKNLAAQTTKATDEIGQQIAGVQSATGGAVTAIRRIAGMISEVNVISTGVAAAVEQQGGATDEIARAAQQAADGTTTMSRTVARVTDTAGAVAEAAGRVTQAVSALADQTTTLRGEVQSFVAGIRQG